MKNENRRNVIKRINDIPIISEFQGTYCWLNNFWYSNMIIDGIQFISNEQWYVYNKTKEPKMREKILNLKKSGDIKRFGRKIKVRDDWEEIKIDIMYKGVEEKFKQNKILQKKLLSTWGMILQEGNTWGDEFWGINLKNGSGKNILGRIIMKVRLDLMEKKIRETRKKIIKKINEKNTKNHH